MIHVLNHIGLKPVRDYVPSADRSESCTISLNPKAFDARRAIGFRQDRPSETAGINETNVYTDPSLYNYRAGVPYPACNVRGRGINETYDINNAQIQYYVDDSIKAPYYSPVYFMPSEARLVDYVDPMDSWKPHYTHKICTPEKYACLSWINDSGFQREDLMARQQAVHNQQRSEPFFNW